MLQKDSWPWTGGYGRGEERGAGKKRRKGEGAGKEGKRIRGNRGRQGEKK